MKLDTTHAKNNHILNIPQPTIIASDDAHNWIPGLWSNFWDHHWIKLPLFTHTSPSSPHPIWLIPLRLLAISPNLISFFTQLNMSHIYIYFTHKTTHLWWFHIYFTYFILHLWWKNNNNHFPLVFPMVFPGFFFGPLGGEWLHGPSA